MVVRVVSRPVLELWGDADGGGLQRAHPSLVLLFGVVPVPVGRLAPVCLAASAEESDIDQGTEGVLVLPHEAGGQGQPARLAQHLEALLCRGLVLGGGPHQEQEALEGPQAPLVVRARRQRVLADLHEANQDAGELGRLAEALREEPARHHGQGAEAVHSHRAEEERKSVGESPGSGARDARSGACEEQRLAVHRNVHAVEERLVLRVKLLARAPGLALGRGDTARLAARLARLYKAEHGAVELREVRQDARRERLSVAEEEPRPHVRHPADGRREPPV
mmetsp:Transcript_33939/g.86991  ORF Transcript_33939/g.86991 Transcript_33939/m.86991 type:complete len:279 (-) Transcript_33939:1094-1930(-)